MSTATRPKDANGKFLPKAAAPPPIPALPPDPEGIPDPNVGVEVAAPDDEGFVARFWTAGPGGARTSILRTVPKVRPDGTPVVIRGMDGKADEPVLIVTKFKPGLEGAITVRTKEDYEFVKGVLQKSGRAWEDDIPKDAPPLYCQACNWYCRSSRAFQHHVNNNHPGPKPRAR